MTSAKDTNDLSIDFDRDRDKKGRELTNNKNKKGKYHVRNCRKDVWLCRLTREGLFWFWLQTEFKKKFRLRCSEKR